VNGAKLLIGAVYLSALAGFVGALLLVIGAVVAVVPQIERTGLGALLYSPRSLYIALVVQAIVVSVAWRLLGWAAHREGG